MQRAKCASILKKTDDWSNKWMKELINIKIPAFEAKVSQNSRFWIYAVYISKTCLKAALVNTPNFRKHHFVLKTTVCLFDPIFIQLTLAFSAMSEPLSLHLHGKMPVLYSTQKKDIADHEVQLFWKQQKFPHIYSQTVWKQAKLYETRNPIMC